MVLGIALRARMAESRAAPRPLRASRPHGGGNRMTAKKVVRVAGGQGFWGDWLEAPRRQVEGGPVDYLMLDYLAEVTMSILQKQKERDPAMGYARDFVGAMESVLPAVAERGVKVIANAGGVNPGRAPPPCRRWPRPRDARRRCASASSPATISCRASTSCSRRGTSCATWTPASRCRSCATASSRPTRTSARRPDRRGARAGARTS